MPLKTSWTTLWHFQLWCRTSGECVQDTANCPSPVRSLSCISFKISFNFNFYLFLIYFCSGKKLSAGFRPCWTRLNSLFINFSGFNLSSYNYSLLLPPLFIHYVHLCSQLPFLLIPSSISLYSILFILISFLNFTHFLLELAPSFPIHLNIDLETNSNWAINLKINPISHLYIHTQMINRI